MYSAISLTVFVIALSLVSAQQPMCNDPDAQVLILGAGFAGISAAKTLFENCITDFLIIEQFYKPGGRVRSTQFNGYTIEFGAQYIFNSNFDTGVVNPIYTLAVECGLTEIRPLTIATAAYDEEGTDVTAAYFEALIRISTIRAQLEAPGSIVDDLRYVRDFTAEAGLRMSGWVARTPVEESAEWMSHDLGYGLNPPEATSFLRYIIGDRASTAAGPTNLVVTDPKGLDSVATCVLYRFLCENDPRLLLNTLVTKIRWSYSCVCVDTINRLTGDEKTYCAPYAIVTFPLTVIQDRDFFEPPLPREEKWWPIQSQTMGAFLKVWILFDETFWDRGSSVDWIANVDGIRGREYYPRFAPIGDWIPGQPPILQVLLTGRYARTVAFQDKNTTMQQIYEIMRRIYGADATFPLDLIMHDFIPDPLFDGNFAYPNPGTNDTVYEQLEAPLGPLYLAGEHTSALFRATIEGAWYSGIRAAEQLSAYANGRPRELTIVFLHDSPTATYDGTISAYFRTNRYAYTVICRLHGVDGTEVDCSDGRASWSGLTPGKCYIIDIFARNSRYDSGSRARRRVCIPEDADSCTVIQINCGVTSMAGLVTIQFGGAGPVEQFSCVMNGQTIAPCESPLKLRDLASGRHRLQVIPMGCPGNSRSLNINFTVQ